MNYNLIAGFRGENLSSSLQSLCLKFLCENLEDWIDFVDTVTDYLPEQFKVCPMIRVFFTHKSDALSVSVIDPPLF